MNDEKRKEFWDVLCELDGKDMAADAKLLQSKIQLPKILCRYRKVNSNNLEALRTNKIYLSKASQYDDPFDTFLHFNINSIKTPFESNFQTHEAKVRLANAMDYMIKHSSINIDDEMKRLLTTPEGLTEVYNKGITDSFTDYIMNMRTALQEQVLSACFSEDCFEETLWIKYADNHKGFALVYDNNILENCRCGKESKCENCIVKNYGYSMLPIYYSDIPYDATNFALPILEKHLENQTSLRVPDFAKSTYSNITWDIRRCSLIKKECHKHDKEWRLLANFITNKTVCIEWIPAMVIIGLRTSKSDTNLIVSLAKEAGIKKVYKSFIDINNVLSLYPIFVDENQNVETQK